MAVTLDGYATQPGSIHQNIQGFANNASSADWQGTEEIVAAIAGKSIYVESISVTCVVAMNIRVLAGEDKLWSPVRGSASGTFASHYFRPPLKVAEATAINALGTAAGVATIMITGYIV